MKTQNQIPNKFNFIAALAGIFLAFAASTRADDPRTNCWFTTYSGQYARVYTNNAMLANGTALTSWSNGSQTQSPPAYCGPQEIYSSASWIYVRSTGLASYTMGPWQNGAFPNLPVNQKLLFRFPRTNNVPTTKTLSGGGQIGIFVDGVEMFNSWDAFYWNGTADTGGGGTGYWNRDAYVNEGATFDPGYAHQQNTGTYHYHASPIALRYLLGDHVDYNAATKTYSEDTNAPTKHSPILAWTADGFPLYGPYGYSNATNASSGIRRMISGYVIRNGSYGTSNLTANGRTTIPQWAVRLFNVASNIIAGPAVSSSYPLGRYMEDNDYLGDHGYVQGTDFDLDEYNGRYCVTPEFPNGTYAYFVAISSNGTPVFPYNIGRGYYGSPVGSSVTSISESVVTNFLGNTNLASTLNAPGVNNGTVTLTWSALEGGSYQVETTTNFSTWTVLATNISPNEILGGYTNVTASDKNFYRVGRAAVASFDPASGTTGTGGGGGTQGISSVLPASANRGTNSVADNVTLTITLNTGATMPPPPNNVQPTSVTLTGPATLTATSYSRNTTTGVVTAVFSIASTATPGAYTVNAVFGPNTWSLANGFTIN
jgi:hypothetical protein